MELIHWLLKNLIQPKTQSQPPYNSLGGPCTATQSLLCSWDMIQEPLTHVSAPLSAPFKALMAQKRIFKKRNYPLAIPGSVLWDGSLEARQQSLQSLVFPTKCPIYSECPVHNMNRLYVGHCTNSDFQDLIMLTAGNPVFCGTWEKSSTRLSTHTHTMFPALRVRMMLHGYRLSFCPTALHTDTSSEDECAGSTGTTQKDEAETFRRIRKSSRFTDCWIQWATHCLYDRGPWQCTGCSLLYLWPHYQRAAAQPWQSNWCFGMRVEERWAPPLGHGPHGLHEAAHTHTHTSCLNPKHTTGSFVVDY